MAAVSRIRSIKPEFFLDDELAELSPLTRILFEGLWTQADREGRLENRPRRLKAALLPYDECDIEEMLETLAPKFITLYEQGEHRFIQVVNFARHQCPNAKELPSTIPAPCQDSTSTPLLGRERKGREGKGTREYRAPKEEPTPLSGFPPCMTSDLWRVDSGPEHSSVGHIRRAIEKKHGMAVSPAQIGELGSNVCSACPEGCTGDGSHVCAQKVIEKIGKAGSLKLAGDWYASDRGLV